ncbi:MAG: tetratricopeptide repeat protein [Pseudodesulfovibrio sp.]
MDGQTLFLHGVRLHQAGELAKAVGMYREALNVTPDNGEAALYMGLALQQLGALSEAETAYRSALTIMPGDPDILNGIGTVCLELGKLDEATEAHQAVLKNDPNSAPALGGMGNILLSQGKLDNAIDCFQKSLSIAPDSPDTLSNLGVALKNAGRAIEAVQTFEAALSLNPESTDTLYNLGNAWQLRGDMGKAQECFRRAQTLAPESVAPRWGGCFSHLDVFYDTDTDIESARNQYAQSLAELDKFLTLDTPEQIRDAATSVGANQPFYLTYQGKNDRKLQGKYGSLVNRIMTAAYPQFSNPSFQKRTDGKIRVGIATGFMHEHSVWKIPTRGWAKYLDREKFEVFGYYTGVKDDHCTAEARKIFDHFTHEPNHFEALCTQIFEDHLDVLVYPDIGMDPTCAKLAGLRLAPAQCVSLGHPMTTGLPTMDYFLSSDLMEPEDGDQAYTEQLVRLPNLSVHYAPIRQGEPQFDRAHFGLPKDALLYFCPQSLYKYLPEHDRLYPLIAKAVPNCRFVFLQNGHADRLNERFAARLSRAFGEHGLDANDYVTMLPYQAPEEYHALNCLCDVFLDSIQWSGFNTAMEAANAGLPAITLPKGHMRGRHTYAVETMLGNNEAVADTFDAYVELAMRMGMDTDFRHALRERTKKNRSRLFGDMEAIRGLELFIEQVAR